MPALLTHNELRITERRLPVARLPKAFEGFRIVQVSDLHFYEHSDDRYDDRVAAHVNALNADALAVTGDVIHYGGDHIHRAEAFFSRLKAREARLAILGNHDYYDDAKSAHIRAMWQRAGYDLLVNAHRSFRREEARLWIAGLDDLWYGAPDLHQALAGIPTRDEVTLVLAHNPLLFDPIAWHPEFQVDAVISGHTHAGHVYIPFLGPIYRRIFRMKYRYGLYEKNGTRLHVTSGVGSAAFYLKKRRVGFPRFRFNTWPEIAVLTLTQE